MSYKIFTSIVVAYSVAYLVFIGGVISNKVATKNNFKVDILKIIPYFFKGRYCMRVFNVLSITISTSLLIGCSGITSVDDAEIVSDKHVDAITIDSGKEDKDTLPPISADSMYLIVVNRDADDADSIVFYKYKQQPNEHDYRYFYDTTVMYQKKDLVAKNYVCVIIPEAVGTSTLYKVPLCESYVVFKPDIGWQPRTPDVISYTGNPRYIWIF